jgi:hypothetical protein
MAGYNAEWQKELERLKKQRQNQQLARAPMLNTDDARANTDVEMSQAEMMQLEKGQPGVEITAQQNTSSNIQADRIAAASKFTEALAAQQGNTNPAISGVQMGAAGAGLGASLAASGGTSVAGGAALGAGVGIAAGVGVGLIQAHAAKKQRERELENQKLRMIADIEQNRAAQLNSAISGMASRIGSSLQTHVLRL